MEHRNNTSSGSPRLLQRPDRAADEFPETVQQAPGSLRNSWPWTHHPPGRCCPDTISPSQHKSTALLCPWPQSSLLKPSPGELLPISGHIVLYFTVQIVLVLVFVLCYPFSCLAGPHSKFSTPLFPGPLSPRPARSLPGSCKRKGNCSLFLSPIESLTYTLFTHSFAVSCKLSPFLSLRCALLPKKQGGVPLPTFSKNLPPVFSTTYEVTPLR